MTTLTKVEQEIILHYSVLLQDQFAYKCNEKTLCFQLLPLPVGQKIKNAENSIDAKHT